jgi:uncharacterized membrane protein YuzA (DUF378 family)
MILAAIIYVFAVIGLCAVCLFIYVILLERRSKICEQRKNLNRNEENEGETK